MHTHTIPLATVYIRLVAGLPRPSATKSPILVYPSVATGRHMLPALSAPEPCWWCLYWVRTMGETRKRGEARKRGAMTYGKSCTQQEYVANAAHKILNIHNTQHYTQHYIKKPNTLARWVHTSRTVLSYTLTQSTTEPSTPGVPGAAR